MDKKFVFQLVGLILVIFIGTAFAFNPELVDRVIPSFKSGSSTTTSFSSSVRPVSTKVLRILDSASNSEKVKFNIEVADTEESKRLGLGGRSVLAQDAGMIFPYSSPVIPTFWMKGMKIPLDFIWILDDRVADLLPNIQPPVAGQKDETLERYASKVPVNIVLEVNAGVIAQKNIRVGDKVIIGESTTLENASPSPNSSVERLPQ